MTPDGGDGPRGRTPPRHTRHSSALTPANSSALAPPVNVRIPSTHPAIPTPQGKAEVLAMKKDRGDPGPGLEVIDATSRLQRNRQVVAHVLGQVRTRVRARNLSPRTEKTYLGWMERYVGYHGLRDPAGMGRADIEAFLGHLGAELGLGAASLNQAAAACLVLIQRALPGGARRKAGGGTSKAGAIAASLCHPGGGGRRDRPPPQGTSDRRHVDTSDCCSPDMN